jgi:prepilin-type N-terminal cleavage/methylation domain-containing protein
MIRHLQHAKRRAFTLVEMLAALAFMGIVIPVIMHALTIANRAGQVAQRKAIAARVADRVLSDYVANAQQNRGLQKGVVDEGPYEFTWNISLENWREDNMRLVTAEVTYPVQGQKYSVETSTLIGLTQ